MKNKLGVLAVCVFAFVSFNSVMAQSSGAYLDCGDEAIEPGEERQCFAQFSSDFNWSDYDYNWSVSSGEVISQSVESVAFVAPNKTSSGEVVVEGSVTDGSGQVISFESSVEFESKESSQEQDNVSELKKRVKQQESQIKQQESQIQQQKERIRNQTQRIESQQETIQSLRQTIRELRVQENESKETRPTNPGNSSEARRPEKRFNQSENPGVNDSDDQASSENKERRPEPGQEQRSDENQTKSNEDTNQSSEKTPQREEPEQGSGSFLDVVRGFFR